MINRLTGIGEYGRTWLLDHPDPRPERKRMPKKKTTRKSAKKRARKKSTKRTRKRKAPTRSRARPSRVTDFERAANRETRHGDATLEAIADELEYMERQFGACAALGLRLAEIIGASADPIVRSSMSVLLRKQGATSDLAALIHRHLFPPVETGA